MSKKIQNKQSFDCNLLDPNSINYRVCLIGKMRTPNPRQFAERIGSSDTVIRNIIGGRQNKPGYDTLEKIMQSFDGINAQWLLTGKGEMFISEDQGQPIRTYDNLENFGNTQSALHKCLECKKKDETIEELTQQLKYLRKQLSKYEKEFEETREDASKTKLGLK